MPNNIFAILLKRATYASTGILMARIAVAIAVIIIARTVGPTQFGAYAAVWAFIGVSAAFTEIGMITGLKREGSRLPNSLSTLLGNTLIVKAMIGTCAMVIAYFSFSIVTTSAIASMLFLPLAIAGFSTLHTVPFYSALQVKGQQKLVSFLMIGRGLLFLMGIIILASFGFDIVTFAWYQGLLYSVMLIITSFTGISVVSIAIDFSRIISQIKGSLVFGISALLYTTYTQIPILFLSHFRPEEEVGYFAVGLRFITLIILAGSAASNDAFIPSLFGLYKTNREKYRQVFESIQKLFISLGIFAASALYVCADALIIILQGEEYRPAVGILRILCLAVTLNYATFASGAALTTSDRMRTKIAFQICVTIIILITGIPIIKHYGTIGASIVTIIIWFCLILLYTSYAYRVKIISSSVFSKDHIPSFLTALLAILIVHFIPDHNLLGPVIFLLGSIIVWRSTAMRMLKNTFLTPHTTEEV